MAWFTGGIQVNPVINQIIADTLQLPAGVYGVELLVSATVNSAVVIEQRNAANTVNINSHIFPLAANTTEKLKLLLNLAADERVRLRMNAGVTGSVQGSLFTYQISD